MELEVLNSATQEVFQRVQAGVIGQIGCHILASHYANNKVNF